ncbi:PAS domain S-box protein [bacterium]|nr:PAS domain S-box protein [bacterium]
MKKNNKRVLKSTIGTNNMTSNTMYLDQLWNMYSQSTIPTVISDSEGNIIRYNDAMYELTGYTYDEVADFESWMTKVYPDETYRKEVVEISSKARQHEIDLLRYRLVITRKDGQKRYTEFSSYDIVQKGKRTGEQIVQIVDITGRITAEKALQYRIDFEQLIVAIINDFITLKVDEIDSGIKKALEEIGKFTGVDRSYIFVFTDDMKKLSNTHEWCAEGIEPQIQRIQELPVERLPYFFEKMKRNEIFYVPCTDDLPVEAQAEKEELKEQSIKSLIDVPLIYSGILVGMLGFDAVLSERMWTQDEITLLKIAGGMFVNVLERKRTEKALRDSEEKFRQLFEMESDALFLIENVSGRILEVNNAGVSLYGYSKEELLGMRNVDLSDEADQTSKATRGHLTRIPVRYHRRKNGTVFPVEIAARHFIFQGREVHVAAIRDITERHAAQEELQRQEEFLKMVIDQLPVYIAVKDRKARVILANRMYTLIFGLSMEQMMGKTSDVLHADREAGKKIYRDDMTLIHKEKPFIEYEDQFLDKQGTYHSVNTLKIPLFDKNGDVEYILIVGSDMTSQKQAEHALRESERILSTLISNLPGIAYRCKNDEYWTMEFISERCKEITGYDSADLIGNRVLSYDDIIHPDDREMVRVFVMESLSENKPFRLNYRIITASGQEKWVWEQGEGVPSDDSELATIEGFIADITNQKAAQEALRESEERYRSLFETSLDPIMITSFDGTVLNANKAWFDIFGYQREEVIGHDIRETYVRQEDRKNFLFELEKKGYLNSYPLQFRKKDGSLIDFEVTTNVRRKEDGQIAYFQSVGRDVTERRRLEMQFLQAQKMEMVARLAGGIAHDFNNLLTAIIGYAEIIMLSVPPMDPIHFDVEEILKTSQRAANLTRQLLAFSRRQIIEPRIINLNKVLLEMNKMLRRIIGEDIELVILLPEDLWFIKVDPGQIEQVLTNLVVNARDAMPNGGKLTIETRNVMIDQLYADVHPDTRPGDYVLIAVSDTGIGMDQETMSHLFEPFFTTKEKGKGTGLGLSTCYGIVKQNLGNIWIYSELGHGTTVKIYLPRTAGEPVHISFERDMAELPEGSETVLVVEDETSVRRMVSRLLREHGYTVLEAINGEEALRVVDKAGGSGIHLLLTDVIMPRMGGKELAIKLSNIFPDIKVLYMSGYTDNSIVSHGVLDPGIDFLQKPFSPRAFLEKVRKVLDQKPDE